MKKILCLMIVCLLVGGCGSKPSPAWISQGHQQFEAFKKDFLAGTEPLVTEYHFRKALEEIKKSGDIDLMGKAWLTRMALQVAVLEEMEEGEYRKVEAAEPVPANRNFDLFLKGDATAVDENLLPPQYRPFLAALRSGNAPDMEKAVMAIEDPLSRLIAAGIVAHRHLENEALLGTAVETASRNGWKRALLAWLKRLMAFHEASKAAAKAAAIRDRINLIKY